MKQKILILTLLMSFMLVSHLQLQAVNIDKTEAEALAVKFMRGQHQSKSMKAINAEPKVTSVVTKHAKDADALYICNFVGGGFAIVSAKDIGYDNIIAYSPTGSFDYDKAPESARHIIDMYAENIANLSESVENTSPLLSASLANDVTAIEPLLGTTTWNQGYPYNILSPKIDDVPTLTGCVPTAMAQIMYYYKYPQSATGKIDYEWNGTRLTANLSESVYQWDKMTPNYDDRSTEESKQAVARLMTDIGYACNTQFGTESSSTPNIYPPVAFVNNFKYDQSLRWIEKRFFSDEEWLNIILDELKFDRPVYYSGDNAYRTGHAYVCDGVDAEGRLHFNFGWGGESDGYYVANSQLFGDKAEMIGNIKPDEGGKPVPEGYLYSAFYFDGTYVLLNCKIMTGGARDIPVEIALEYKNGATVYYQSYARENAYLWMEMVLNPIVSDQTIDDGEYEIRPVFRIRGEGESKDTPLTDYDWQYFHHIPGSQYYLACTVENGNMSIENTMDEPIDEGRVQIGDFFYILDDAAQEATVTYRNKINPTYKGDIVIPSSIEFEGKTYTVTQIGESAFEGCRGLTSAVIPKTVKVVGYGSFSQSWAKEIRFEEGSQLEIIDEYAFNAMDQLEKINLPQGLKEIRLAGLRGLNVRAIDIPSSVTYIGEEALDGYRCRDITLHWNEPLECGNILEQKQYHFTDAFNIHVPEGTENKYAKVKPWCNHEIDSNTPVGESPVVISDNGIYYELYYDATVIEPDNEEDWVAFRAKESIEIPSTVSYNGKDYTVKRIGEGTISGCAVKSLIIPSSVKKIENFNMTSCENLTTVIFANDSQLEIIGQNCFQWCGELSEIQLPASLKRIGFFSFSNISIPEIDIPESVAIIDYAAFKNCGNISMRFHTAFPPYVQYDAFNPDYYPVLEGSNPTIIVPKNCKQNYESYEFWNGRNIIEDDSMQPSIDIQLPSTSTVTISVPEQAGADYYEVTVSNESGSVVDQKTIGAPANNTRSISGFSCTLNLSSDAFYQFTIEAYSDARGKLKEINGQFNNLTTDGISIENIEKDKYLYDIFTPDGITIGHQIDKDNIKHLPKGVYILRNKKETIKIVN
ncbi:MAG: C10 family peptidase [Prevotella sp.]